MRNEFIFVNDVKITIQQKKIKKIEPPMFIYLADTFVEEL